MSLIPQYEERDGFVLIPKDEYTKMSDALINIAVTGVLSRDYLPEVLEAFDFCHDTARWDLGWKQERFKNK